jgi:hypothetical protein
MHLICARRLRIRNAAAATLIGGTLLLAGCVSRVSIESINHDPARFDGKEIKVAGRVVNSFTVAASGAFELDDGTGRLWVFRDNKDMPAHNSSLTVNGTIEQGFDFGGRNFIIILRETSRH